MLPSLFIAAGLTGYAAWKQQDTPQKPGLPGPTDAEVLASDLRLRRRLGQQNNSNMISGGLSGTPTRITLPTLIGT